MIYDKEYLTNVLKKHGYPTINVTPEWLQFALLLVIAESNSKDVDDLHKITDFSGNDIV